MIVVDASVAVSWFMREQRMDAAEAALTYVEQNDAFAPSNFFPEFLNAFVRAERRGRIKASDTAFALCDIRDLDISIQEVASELIVELARAHALTAYDAAYLAVACSLNIPLVTLDGALAKAAASLNLLWTPPKKKREK